MADRFEDEAHERNVHLLLERKIHDAGHTAHGLAHPLAQPPQRRQIVAEDLDGDIRPGPGQHVVDPVRDRLTDGHVGPRQRREAAPQIREQVGARAPRLFQADVDFRRLHALHVLVQLGASGSPRRGDDLGLREEDLLDAAADLVGLGQRGARAAYWPGR